MRQAQRHFIFTLTAGRTGTAFLADFLRANMNDAEVHHERFGFDLFGVETPDLSHFTLFNSQGNVPKVQEFWKQKLRRILDVGAACYAETSHVLMKAGLVENIEPLLDAGTVHLVNLTRDIVDTIASYRRRMDFVNRGNMWLWYLDPGYPRTIVDFQAFESMGWEGICYWYICEVRTRAEYYRLLLEDEARVCVHDVQLEQLNRVEGASALLSALGQVRPTEDITIPPPANESPRVVKGLHEYRESVAQKFSHVQFDPRVLAAEYYERGGRLGRC